jgi:hypothetical protein
MSLKLLVHACRAQKPPFRARVSLHRCHFLALCGVERGDLEIEASQGAVDASQGSSDKALLIEMQRGNLEIA